MRCSRCGHDTPNGKASCLYCGAVLGDADRLKSQEDACSGREVDRISDLKDVEGYLTRELVRMADKRRGPVSKTALACIFFLSMLLGGMVVWWFR